MDSISCKDILGFSIDRASAINTYWNIFIGVSTGLVGIMASGKEFTASNQLKLFLSVAFIVFAYSNLDAILNLGKLRTTFLSMLPTGLQSRDALVTNLKPAEPWQYVMFHLTFDIIVLSAIWFVNWPQASLAK